MANHAGFGTSLVFAQSVLQNIMTALHRANLLPHELNQTFSSATFDLFLDVPTIVFSAANNNQVSFSLQGWGPMEISSASGMEDRQVLFRAEVTATLTASLSGQSLTLAVDGSSASVISTSTTVLAGPQLTPAEQTELSSPAFQAQIQTYIQTLVNGFSFPPISLSFLQLSGAQTTITSRVLDSALALGIDVASTQFGVATHGDPNQLTDTTDGHDFAMWMNPVVLPVRFADILQKATQKIEAKGGTLNGPIQFVPQEGQVHVVAKATFDGFQGTLTMDAVPKLVVPGPPPRSGVWLDIVDVNVDINRPAWLDVVEAAAALIFAWVGPKVIEDLITMFRDEAYSAIGDPTNGATQSASSEFTLTKMGDKFLVTLQVFDSHVEGILLAGAFRPEFPAAWLAGPDFIPIDDLRRSKVPYIVTLPAAAHPADPNLFVRWTVYRTDTNAIVVDETLPVASTASDVDALSFSLGSIEPMSGAPDLSVAAYVFRALGPITEGLYQRTIAVRMYDPIDKTHPYVWWEHGVGVPEVRVEADGTHTFLGRTSKLRRSRLHRTDFPGRCIMVSRLSGKVFTEPTPTTSLNYLDQLPFPRQDLLGNRRQVCDYCFFGGPTKTVPLIP
jgi:hypothetical protein